MAGQGKKTFASNEVLTAADVNGYLMDQSVMRFANSGARGSAIGTAIAEGMVSYLDDTNAVEVYDGSAWKSVGQDLTTGTSGFTALSAGTAGISYQPVSHNYIINGAFDVWQRGTAGAGSFAYTADRFLVDTSSIVSQSTDVPAGVGVAYSLKHTGATAAVSNRIPLELNRVGATAPYDVGTTWTVSFYAKATADRAVSVSAAFRSFGPIGAAEGAVFSSVVVGTMTSSWQRFTHTFTIPSVTLTSANTLAFQIASSAGASADFFFTGVQLEAGSVATPFKRHAPSLQGELAACQRYYYRINADGATSRFAVGHNFGTTTALVYTAFPVRMRVAPSALEQTGTAADYSIFAQSSINLSSVPTFNVANTDSALTALTVASGLTAGQGAQGRFTSTTAFLGWSAEL